MEGISSDLNNVHLKLTHHHYVGFYSLTILSMVRSDNLVRVLDQEYLLRLDKIINWSYDTQDVIVAEQRYFECNDEIPQYTPVYNSAGELMSLITKNLGNKYPVSNGFTTTNIHITDVTLPRVIVKPIDKPIAYADQLFVNKSALTNYLRQPHKTTSRKVVFFKTSANNSCQVIVSENGRNIINVHFRCPLVG